MFVFIVPLRSKQVSNSFDRVSVLLERTLRSICNQTNSNFQVIVVCHEKPQISFTHPAVELVSVDFPPPSPNASKKDKNLDRSRKIWLGLNYIKSSFINHVMYVDSDDLVSNKLVSFCNNSPNANGWLINKGYEYSEGSQSIYSISKNFYGRCGSSLIMRYDLTFPFRDLKFEEVIINRFIYHQILPQTLADEMNAPLVSLPFHGAVYITNTGENNLADMQRYKELLRNKPIKLGLAYVRKEIKNIFSKEIKDEIREEFGIYDV